MLELWSSFSALPVFFKALAVLFVLGIIFSIFRKIIKLAIIFTLLLVAFAAVMLLSK
jgi:hypothetical protein